MPKFDQRDTLDALTKPRLLEIAAGLGLGLPGHWAKAEIVDAIASSTRAPLPRILELLSRDELEAICRTAGVDDSGRDKAALVDRILGQRPEGGTDTLTKVGLMEAVAATGLLKKDAELIVHAVLETLVGSLQAGETIELRGFGSFRLRKRKPRTGRNPKTGEPVEVPAKRVCYFRPGRTLLEILNP